MQDLNLQYKPDDTLRVCPTIDCGRILEGRAKHCTECIKEKRNKRSQKWRDDRIGNKKETHPTWKCDKCEEVITFNFNIIDNNRKFEKIIAEHIC